MNLIECNCFLEVCGENVSSLFLSSDCFISFSSVCCGDRNSNVKTWQCVCGVCVCPLCRCLLGWWMEKRSQRMGCVQGAFPHSPACQRWYLSASNRGTGEDRQHLLSKPNYLLSTKQEAEPAPPPALWSATLTLHIRAQLWFFIHSLTDGKLGG